MSLARAYAAVIADAEEKKGTADFVKKLVALMKARGHLSLLPQIVRILDREQRDANVPVVTVAKEADAKKFAKPIHDALSKLGAETKQHELFLDPQAVGGYTVRAGSRLIDKTFRSALISLYQDVTTN